MMSPLVLAIVIAASNLGQPLQFGVPTFLIARRQPQRDGFVKRFIAAFALLLAFNLVASVVVWIGMTNDAFADYRNIINAVAYTLYLVVLVQLVLHCFDTSVWNALFCATSGYTIQNLGSGIGEFIRILVQLVTGTDYSELFAAIISNVTIAVVIVIYYFVFIRKVDRIGRLGEDSRNMFGMLVLVILGVIAFDIIVRGLERAGAEPGFLLALRVVHFAVSNFILFAEYEMLYNASLRAEVAAQELLAGERERQYQLSRETIAAVNRRVHDIRHKVVADLTEGDAQVSREVLASVAQDISVFDTQVKTGNDVLDTILTEKSLVCARRGVTLSCIADGTAMAGLPTTDLYALFGSLLDGAIDAVCELENKAQRSVSLTLRQVGNLALLHMEHYGSADEPAAVREIVERHEGTLTVSSGDDTTVIDIMLSAE